MKALRVGTDYYVDADDIMLVQPWGTRPSKREKERASEAGTYYDATGGRPILTLITLKGGHVVASPFQARTLIERPVIRANIKATAKRSALPLDDSGRVILEGDRVLVPSREMPALPASSATDDEANRVLETETDDEDDTPKRGFLSRFNR